MIIKKLERLDQLIKLQATGSPIELAKKIGMSERMIYKYIDFMKTALHAPIEYSRDKKTYRYTENGAINFKWEKKN
jgi:predicted DNA-binding transcriptional regulator YafY